MSAGAASKDPPAPPQPGVAAVVDVSVTAGEWDKAVPGAPDRCRRAAAAAMSAVGPRTGAVEISIVLADDSFVRALNRDWRGRDAATNVLAFPTGEAGPAPAEGVPRMLGDVVVALETLLAEARREGKPAGDHLAHLVVHGVLHLLGHDHAADAEAEAMEALEAAALASLGIDNPYA